MCEICEYISKPVAQFYMISLLRIESAVYQPLLIFISFLNPKHEILLNIIHPHLISFWSPFLKCSCLPSSHNFWNFIFSTCLPLHLVLDNTWLRISFDILNHRIFTNVTNA